MYGLLRDRMDTYGIIINALLNDSRFDQITEQCLSNVLKAQTGFGSPPTSSSPLIIVRSLTRLKPVVSKKLKREERVTQIELEHKLSGTNGLDLFAYEEQIDKIWSVILGSLISDAADDDIITGYIEHGTLESDIWIGARLKRDVKYDAFLNSIASVTQSNRQLLANGKFTVRVGIVKARSGGASRRAPVPMFVRAQRKKSVVRVEYNDQVSCFWIAIQFGLIHQNLMLSARQKDAERRRSSTFESSSRLARSCGLRPEFPVKFIDLRSICDSLQINLIIVSGDGTNSRMFPRDTALISRETEPIFLEYSEIDGEEIGHFNFINSIAGYIEYTDFCYFCWTKVAQLGAHVCDFTCKSCFSQKSTCSNFDLVICEGCDQTCFGVECLERHQRTCKKFNVCTRCEVRDLKNSGRKHKCFWKQCRKCSIYYETLRGPHYCFISNLCVDKLKKQDKELKVTVAFDIESMLVDNSNGLKEHFADLLVCETKCDDCMFQQADVCINNLCDKEQRVFSKPQNFTENVGCVKDFCDFLYLDLARRAEAKKAKLYVYAHNLSGYDGRFIFRDLLKRNFGRPEFIQVGSKMIFIEIANVRFIDSCKLFPMPLKALTKAFNLQSRKGYFPYESNVAENRNKKIPLPEKGSFGYFTTMTTEDRQTFDLWYDRQPPTYDIEREKLAYCKDDVKVLLESILTFRKQLIEMTGIDPTVRRFTIASVGMEIFRALHLPNKRTLARTPTAGYGSRTVSVIGEAFLDAAEDALNIKILREVNIGRYFVDGFHYETKTAFEYDGCYMHGCHCTFPNADAVVAPRTETASEIRRATEMKHEYLKRLGFKLIVGKDCCNPYKVATKRRAKEIRLAKKKLEMMNLPRRINLRQQALKGGRTNNIKFYFESNGLNELKYVDFTSLYPYVLKYRYYPRGHPEIITRNFKNISEYFGFIYCEVSPPAHLRIPVLGLKINNKFVFPLCRTCVAEKSQTACAHEDSLRNIFGVWTTVELQLALEKGYRIVSIFEVLHYKEKHADLYKGYIDMHLRNKQEAEGYGGRVGDERVKYVKDYKEHEGIDLRPDHIGEERNEGKRTISKLGLNTNWGESRLLFIYLL